jgi:hypothetical protein
MIAQHGIVKDVGKLWMNLMVWLTARGHTALQMGC